MNAITSAAYDAWKTASPDSNDQLKDRAEELCCLAFDELEHKKVDDFLADRRQWKAVLDLVRSAIYGDDDGISRGVDELRDAFIYEYADEFIEDAAAEAQEQAERDAEGEWR